MNRNYIVLTFLLLMLAGGLFLLPERQNYQHMDPEELMWDIVQPTRYVSTDQVAKMIIEGDPTLKLVDVRSAEDFQAFSLPAALNVPLDHLLDAENRDYIGLEDRSTVFYAEDDIKSDQAWVIARRLGYNSVYVMKGGLNCWIKTIIKPEMPAASAAKPDFDLYSFRKGASLYFTGTDIEATDEGSKQAVQVVRKKKSSVAEGGC